MQGRHKKDDNGTFEENIQHAEAGYPSIHSQNEVNIRHLQSLFFIFGKQNF